MYDESTLVKCCSMKYRVLLEFLLGYSWLAVVLEWCILVETRGLCIQVNVQNRKEICSNQERSPSGNLGMWEVHWLHLRAEVSDWIRPQAIDTIAEHKTSGQYGTTNSEIQTASSEVWLLSMPCSWQTLVYSRHSVQSADGRRRGWLITKGRSVCECCCRTFSASYRTMSEHVQMCTGARPGVSAGYRALLKRLAKERIGEAWHCTLLEGPRLIDGVQPTVAVGPSDCGSKVIAWRDQAENSCWSSGNTEMQQSKRCFLCMVPRSESAAWLLKQCNIFPSVPWTQLLTRSHWWFCNCQSTHGK